MIILNEHEYAMKAIEQRDLGKDTFRTCSLVARLYLDKGYSKSEAREMLNSFVISCSPNISLPLWSDMLDNAMKRAIKHDAKVIGYIGITKGELDVVDSIKGVQKKRLAFTLLCLSKYWNIANKTDTCWVNSDPNDILKLANINTSIKRESEMYRDFYEQGLIQFSKKVDNNNVRVLFHSEGEQVLKIYDFRNLGYQYLRYCGQPFFECSNCGIVDRLNASKTGGRPRKYCKKCTDVVKGKQMVEVMRRRRASFKNT